MTRPSGRAGHQRKDTLFPSGELSSIQKPQYLLYTKKLMSEFQEKLDQLNWFSEFSLELLVYFKLESPARSENVMVFKVWLVEVFSPE